MNYDRIIEYLGHSFIIKDVPISLSDPDLSKLFLYVGNWQQEIADRNLTVEFQEIWDINLKELHVPEGKNWVTGAFHANPNIDKSVKYEGATRTRKG